ncbi:MAG: hypothetical protein AAFV19_02495 [Pseudomonadota bacterium]
MSETDSFIQEVTEEVRQDRMFALWKKWGPFGIAAIALIVGGAAYWSYQQDQTRQAAEARGGTFIAADPADPSQQIALAERIDGPAQLIAALTAAGAEAEDGQYEAARTRYLAIAAAADVPREYADLARLQAVRAGAAADGADLAALSAELDPLVADGAPYRLLAQELRASLAIQDGRIEDAHKDLRAILDDGTVTDGLRLRASEMLTTTGG